MPIVDLEVGMEKQFFAVTADMVEALNAIGITVTDHALYLTITSRGAIRIVPVRQATPTANRTNITAPKKSASCRASTNGCGYTPIRKTAATRFSRRRRDVSATRNGPN